MNVTREENSPSQELKRRIFQIERLASMPQVVWQLVQAVGDDNSSTASVVSIIESDSALASRVLALAGSAYYGFTMPVTTIERAVVAIGFQELRLLALGAGLADMFDPAGAPPDWDQRAFWVHCLAVAWIAKEMASRTPGVDSGEVMVAALLHDLGKLLLATHMGEDFQGILAATAAGEPYFVAEARAGLSHILAGFWLARRWDLPEVHQTAIRDHHSPRSGDPYQSQSGLVALSDFLAKGLGFGLVHQSRTLDVPVILENLNLDPKAVREVGRAAREKLPPIMEGWLRLLCREDEVTGAGGC